MKIIKTFLTTHLINVKAVRKRKIQNKNRENKKIRLNFYHETDCGPTWARTRDHLIMSQVL